MNSKNPELVEKEAQANQIALKLAESVDTAWNNRDAKAFARLFHEHADFQFETGEMLRGRDEIEKYYALNVFPRTPEPFRHKATIRHIRYITEDVAIGDGEVEIYDLTELDLQKRTRLKMQCTTVIVKENSLWLLSAVRLMVPRQ